MLSEFANSRIRRSRVGKYFLFLVDVDIIDGIVIVCCFICVCVLLLRCDVSGDV